MEYEDMPSLKHQGRTPCPPAFHVSPAMLAIRNNNTSIPSLDKYSVYGSHKAHILKLLSPTMREELSLSLSTER